MALILLCCFPFATGVINLEERIDCKRGMILDGSGKDVTISGHGLKVNLDSVIYR